MWVQAVFSVMPSSCAANLTERPRTSSAQIWASRGVRPWVPAKSAVEAAY